MALLWRGNYIGGRFVRPAKARFFLSQSPGDLDCPVGKAGESVSAADDAVAAACRAQRRWADGSVARRRQYLLRFKAALGRRSHQLIELIARESGKPHWEAVREVDRLRARVDELFQFAYPRVQSSRFQVSAGVAAECRYRPRGVLVVLGPFNFPAHLAAGQFLPGLLTGNTVVFKPSEKTPFVGQCVAECVQEAGFPAGVFNMVQGAAAVGRRLVSHPDVDAVLFTGSYGAGSAIAHSVLGQPDKLVALEMGGKNAAIVFPDADIRLAARESVVGAFSMAGQRCNATSRVLVHEKVADAFINYFLKETDSIHVGDPLDPTVFMGPLIDEKALESYARAQEIAHRERYEALRSGGPIKIAGRRGYYVRPSVHLHRHPLRLKKSAYRTQEWFVPDVVILVFRSEEEAIRLNNEVPYGLVTSIFTRSRRRFEKFYAQVDTGLVNFNRGTIFSVGRLPFGGLKASGNHRPAGLFAIDACVDPVAVLSDERPIQEREPVPGLRS